MNFCVRPTQPLTHYLSARTKGPEVTLVGLIFYKLNSRLQCI